jgi:putative PIN family toxin of toxin-antitoxin system
MTAGRLAVFDTNVLVSGFLSPAGPPGRIVEWLRTGAIQAALDDRILAEYEEVLHRPELSLPAAEVDLVLHVISRAAVWADIPPEKTLAHLPDPDDAPFAECALALDCPLVTGNKRHFPASAIRGLPLLTPAEFATGLI